MFNNEKHQTVKFIWYQISTIIMFVCITVAAINFGKASILFWYVAPVLMQFVSTPNDSEKKKFN